MKNGYNLPNFGDLATSPQPIRIDTCIPNEKMLKSIAMFEYLKKGFFYLIKYHTYCSLFYHLIFHYKLQHFTIHIHN